MALIYITDIDIFITLIKPKMIWQSTMLEMHPSFPEGGNSTNKNCLSSQLVQWSGSYLSNN